MKNLENNEDYYLVRIEEILSKTFKVSKNKAQSLEDAENLVDDLYQLGKIEIDVESGACYDYNVTAREVEDECLSLYEDIADYDGDYEYE